MGLHENRRLTHFARFLSNRKLAKDGVELARRRRLTDGLQDKSARSAPVGECKNAIGSAWCNEGRVWLAACDIAQANAESWVFAPRRPRRAMSEVAPVAKRVEMPE